ncbi:hypothetical protein [Pseudonocardia sp. WMMC193]|uniref:hypothetical protein n=1 Tax=Pseudonocardia sp. WMMC193 TaxID=2911965 RepID=UPI001F3F3FDA|nr:hypothetical protein [Pseudonocardia sp. WMMC193]MCF7548418.1 hypothetical protein [Pseudonocardia sp. WMMC193]
MTDPIQPAARKPAAKRKPAARKKPAAKPRTRKRASSRKRASTASTAGAAVGTALAAILVAALADLPWWGWVLLAVVVAVAIVGYLVAKARARAAEPQDPPSE